MSDKSGSGRVGNIGHKGNVGQADKSDIRHKGGMSDISP
jgi:hypothetical protein